MKRVRKPFSLRPFAGSVPRSGANHSRGLSPEAAGIWPRKYVV